MISVPTQGANLNILSSFQARVEKLPPFSLPIHLYFHSRKVAASGTEVFIRHLSATVKEFPRSFPTPYTPLLRLSPFLFTTSPGFILD